MVNYFKKQPCVKVHGILTVRFFQHWTARREKVLFDGVVSYLIPSGITIFLPFSPSTSRTKGKSDSKLLTVNRRVTKEVIRRYKKQSWNYTQAWRKKNLRPRKLLSKAKRHTALLFHGKYQGKAIHEAWHSATLNNRMTGWSYKTNVTIQREERKFKPDQNRCQFARHKLLEIATLEVHPMEPCWEAGLFDPVKQKVNRRKYF